MNIKSNTKILITMIIVFLFFVILSTNNLLLFHSLAEFSSIVIGFSVLLIVLPMIKNIDNHFIFWIGISFTFVSLFDLAHTITYKEMNIVSVSSNIPVQLWIAARYWQAITLLLGFTRFKSKFSKSKVVIAQSLLFTILMYIIFNTNIFPLCYVDGSGITQFKTISEFVIIGVIVLSIFFFHKHKDNWDKEFYKYILVSLLLLLLSEFAISIYIEFKSLSNVIGHLFKTQVSILFYVGIYKSVITSPYSLLYDDISKLNTEKQELIRDLEEVSSSSKLDDMTGTFNRNSYNEFVKQFDVTNNSSVGLIILDIDNMKYINDLFGHLEGDKAIKLTSNILNQLIRKDDLLFRFGGDEFVIIITDESEEVMSRLINRVLKKFDETNNGNEVQLSVSCGYHYWEKKDGDITYDKLFAIADANMYKKKKLTDKGLRNHD